MNEREIYLKIENWLSKNYQIAIANVIETWGSSPRPVGSIMAINNKNQVIGSVSGGCIESFVFGKALEVINNGKVQTLDFGVTNSQAWEVGLTCGGKIKVFIEKLSKDNIDLIKKINENYKTRKNLVVATRLKDGKKEYYEKRYEKPTILKSNFFIKNKTNKSYIESIQGDLWFFKIFKNNIRVIIIGAVHIADPLIKFANNLGYEIFLVDPRSNYNESTYKNIKIYNEWPDEALKKIKIDENTAIVTLTHDPKLDDPALIYSLKSKAFFIGSLGSVKTHASRVKRLTKKGFSLDTIEKIHGPIGIDIGAKTPPEIALSIISQIVLRKSELNV